MLLALAAAGYWLYSTGRIGNDAPGGTSPNPRSPAARPQDRPGASGNLTPGGPGSATDAPDLGGTLFDMDQSGAPRKGSGSNPLAERAAERAAADKTRQARLAGAKAAVAAARKKLDAAKAEAAKTSRNPLVTKARDAVNAAEATVKRLRAAGATGSSELVAASKRNLEAKGNLRKALDAAAASDPRVLAAQAELKKAEAELRAARAAK